MTRAADALRTFSLDSAMVAARVNSKPRSQLGAALRERQRDRHLPDLRRGGIAVTVPLSALFPGMKSGAGDLVEHPDPRTLAWLYPC